MLLRKRSVQSKKTSCRTVVPAYRQEQEDVAPCHTITPACRKGQEDIVSCHAIAPACRKGQEDIILSVLVDFVHTRSMSTRPLCAPALRT